MRALILFALTLATAACLSVIKLKEANFDKFIASHNYVLVKFFSPSML